MIIENTSLLKDKNNPLYFGEEMKDSWLTADYDTTTITCFRELVEKRTELSRPLTEEDFMMSLLYVILYKNIIHKNPKNYEKPVKSTKLSVESNFL